MGTTRVNTPTSRVRFGFARADITPPVGIYHPLWGAARHHRATGVHRPLSAEVVALGALDDEQTLIRVQIDGCGFGPSHHDDLVAAVCEGTGVSADRVLICVSHTHSACYPMKNRVHLPGGELIEPYVESIGDALRTAAQDAISAMAPGVISYAAGHCDMAGNRDYWDEGYDGYTCGYNPDVEADDTVVVARVTNGEGATVCTVVNYACHATTLAWENTLISPDYVGAMREVVEAATGAPCMFALGACGDLGPRDGFVGDTAVADRNGRQLGHAAVSALMSLGPPETDFAYAGPVVSGATLGTWCREGLDEDRMQQTARFAYRKDAVDLPYIDLPTMEELHERIGRWRAEQKAADKRGDEIAARDAGAQVERAMRWQGRLSGIPEGTAYPMPFSVTRLGDALWVTTGGEPYNLIQRELRARFPNDVVIFSPLVGVMSVGYLLAEDRYGKGLYQEQPSVLAKGCLEKLIDAAANVMGSL